MSRHTPPDTAARRAVYAVVRREEPVCWLCGRLVDQALSWPHPLSWSADHVLPASTHPELTLVRANLHTAHLTCNRDRGTRPAAALPSRRPRPLTSKDW